MPGRIPALPVAALLAASFSLFVFAPRGDVSAADACLTAPDKPAPQGSRWYYRLEHPSKRKCWRLVGKDQKEQKRAAKAAPQAEPDDETASVTPPPASPPPAVTQAPPAPQPQAKPAPVVTTLVTRNVSNDGGMPQQMLIPPTDAPPSTQVASAEPQPPAAAEPPAPVAVAEPAPAQAVVAPAPAPSNPPASGTTWTMLFVAGGMLTLFGGAAVLILTLVRRQTDVLQAIREREEQIPFEASPEMAPEDHPGERLEEDAPSFAPLPPIVRPVRVAVDDLDDALQEYVQRHRRRAA